MRGYGKQIWEKAGATFDRAGGNRLLEKVGSGLTGRADQLGMGKYESTPYQINDSAFTDKSEIQNTVGILDSRMKDRQGMAAPTMQGAQINQAPQGEWRADQRDLASQLAAQARGEGPSLATMQMNQATDRGMRQAQSLAASQRGLSAGQRARLAANQMSDITSSAAQSAAQGRIQEQMGARQQLADVLAGGRGQDIGLATNQAQLDQGASANNLEAALAAQGQTDAMTQFYTGSGLQLGAEGRQSVRDLEKLKMQQDLGYEGIDAQSFWNQNQNKVNMIGGIGQGAAGAAAMMAASDENLKTDVKDGEAKLEDFLANLSASDYVYKDEKHGKGRYVSPMAQELEKSEIGKSMVVDTPEGKMVNYGRAAGTYLSAAAMLSKRINKLEDALAERKAA